MKTTLYIFNIFILSIYLFSCENECKMSEVQKEKIISDVKEMAIQFFVRLDSNKIDDALKYIDSSATFNYAPFFGNDIIISRDDIAVAYKNITTLNSQWKEIEVYPLMDNLAYYQGSFNQIASDSIGNSQNVVGNISAIIKFQNNNWKFFKGQIYADEKKE